MRLFTMHRKSTVVAKNTHIYGRIVNSQKKKNSTAFLEKILFWFSSSELELILNEIVPSTVYTK